ncbi:unnamed protein product [Ectocarpus sp. 13 AM-2016]
MVDAAVMRNVATRVNLEAFARAGGGVAGDIEVISVWESWCLLVVSPGEGAAEGTVGKVCKAISQAARRWAASHVSMPFESPTYEQQLLMYGKQLKNGRGQRGVEKEAKPSIMADLSRAVSKYGVDLWLDAFCLRGHVGEVAVKKAVEAVLRTELKQKYPGLLAKRRAADAPSSTVDGAGPPDLPPPKSQASAWGSGSFKNSAMAAGASPATGGLFGAPAVAAAGSKMSAQSSAASPARTRQTAGTAGHVGVVGGSCGDGVGAFPTFSFGTIASGPPARAWDMESFGNFAIAAGASPATRGVFGAAVLAGAKPKMLTPASVELPAGTGDGAAGTSSAAAPSSAAGAAGAAATATAGDVIGGRRGGDGAGDVPSFSFGTADRPPSRPPSSVRGSGEISSSGTDEKNSPATASGGAMSAAARRRRQQRHEEREIQRWRWEEREMQQQQQQQQLEGLDSSSRGGGRERTRRVARHRWQRLLMRRRR